MSDLRAHLGSVETLHADSGQRACEVTIPIVLPLRGGSRQISINQTPEASLDRKLITALRRAHAMLGKDSMGPTIAAAPASTYERRLLRLALLAPDIQRDILAGHLPVHCNLEFLMNAEIPCAWPNQRATLSWAAESALAC